MTPIEDTPYTGAPRDDTWQTLAELFLCSDLDYERLLVGQVVQAVRDLKVPDACLEQLQHNVNMTFQGATRHVNQQGPKEQLFIRVLVSNAEARQITQSLPGCWGFFLIDRTAEAPGDAIYRMVEVFVYREGGQHVGKRRG